MTHIVPRDAELASRLTAALAAKGPDYRPRTEHLLPDGRPRHINRLILEDSPYLIQHAHNPVDWYPWGEEAFAKAKAENRPIFLSIGYSTCHWCHVMERESFENEAIAAVLNRHFVAIKVDRESLPDVDEIYMTAVQIIAGHGGWPMSSFLTPDGRPFFGGTYYRPDQFLALLNRVATLWDEHEAELRGAGDEIAARMGQIGARRAQAGTVGREVLAAAVKEAMADHDPAQGGFGGAPKFPRESLLLLLIAEAERHPEPALLAALTNTLDAMLQGGIHDQIGGGFHRYAVDAGWLVPHFEKMLYNQAQLARVYARAWWLTGHERYRRTAIQTLDYVLREMTAPGGGFYSATDADSEGREGAFFVWTPTRVRAALPPEDAALAIGIFGVTDGGNFEGANVLHLPKPLDEVAKREGMPLADLFTRLDRIRETLRSARERRPHPLRDDKILTAWNGMMIATLAEAGDLLGEPRYIEAAARAARFLWTYHRPAPGELWRVHFEGRSSVSGYQEDYAFFAEGLLRLYDATGETQWLDQARELADAMLASFWDETTSTFRAARSGAGAPVGPGLSAGVKGDDPMPSGNAAAMHVLQMLARRSDRSEYGERARVLLAAQAEAAQRWPTAFAYLLAGAGDLLFGETGARQYAAHGVVRVMVRRVDGNRVAVEIDIAPGWHVNSHHPLQAESIATELTATEGWRLTKAVYPEGVRRRLGFRDEPLSLYEGRIVIEAEITSDRPARLLPLLLRIQACNDEICLAPETVALQASSAGR